MEVYKEEDIVSLINKKLEDIFVLMKCLTDESKLSLWNNWQDLSTKFHATIIKIKNNKAHSYYPPQEEEKGEETVPENSGQSQTTDHIIIEADSITAQSDSNSKQLNPSPIDSILIEDIVHSSNTDTPETVGSSIVQTDSDVTVINATSNEAFHISSDVESIENAKSLPDSDILANDLRQLADLAAEVPYNLPDTNHNNQKSLEATLLGKENCPESHDKDDDHIEDSGELFDADNHPDQTEEQQVPEPQSVSEQQSVTEPQPVKTQPRKYPKRQRKSKKDIIYCYTDTTEDGEVPKSNKENCEEPHTAPTTDKTNLKKRGRKKKEKFTSVKDDAVKNVDGSVTCKICGLRLARATSLIAHQRQHTGSRPFKCSFCTQSFTTKANMLRHENSHKGIKPFTCEICSKSFGEKKTLKVHMSTHTGDKPFKCPICSESFAQKGTLQYHIYRHTGHKGFLCSDCGRSFRQKCQLRCHRLRQHDKTPPKFSCDMCTSVFYSKNDLRRHKMKHTNSKPFVCDVCSKAYTRADYLKQHQNIHKGIKPYYCTDCNIQFHQAGQFYRHVKKIHPKASVEHEQQTLMGEDFDIPVMANLTQEQVEAVLEHPNGYGEVFHIAYLEQPGAIIDDRTMSDDMTVTADMSNVMTVPNGLTVTNNLPVTNMRNISVSNNIIVTNNMNQNAIVTVGDNMAVSDSVTMSDELVTSNDVETVIIHPSMESEVDFSAINLLANATTQLTQ